MFSSLSRKDKDISGVLTFLLWVFNISSTKTEIILLFFCYFHFCLYVTAGSTLSQRVVLL